MNGVANAQTRRADGAATLRGATPESPYLRRETCEREGARATQRERERESRSVPLLQTRRSLSLSLSLPLSLSKANTWQPPAPVAVAVAEPAAAPRAAVRPSADSVSLREETLRLQNTPLPSLRAPSLPKRDSLSLSLSREREWALLRRATRRPTGLKTRSVTLSRFSSRRRPSAPCGAAPAFLAKGAAAKTYEVTGEGLGQRPPTGAIFPSVFESGRDWCVEARDDRTSSGEPQDTCSSLLNSRYVTNRTLRNVL